MVKVYKCHNFKSQSVLQVSTEPLSIAACGNKVFVATENFSIEVFQCKEEDGSLKYFRTNCFSTEAVVKHITYSSAGNFICTTECKTSRKKEFFSVKIYLNWEISTCENPATTHVRLAGFKNISKFFLSKEINYVDVIDIPYYEKISSIATCSQSGNVAVASRYKTNIYHIIEKTVLNSDLTFLDAVLFLQLEWSMLVEHVSLCENFMAVISDKEVQVVKVDYLSRNIGSQVKPDVKGKRSVSVESFRIANRKTSSSIINPLSVYDKDSVQGIQEYLETQFRQSAVPSPALSNSSKSTKDPFSCIQDDENYVCWKFEENLPSRNSQKIGSGHQNSNSDENKTVFFPLLQEMINRDILLAGIPKIFDLRGNCPEYFGEGHLTTGEVRITTLLYKRWTPSELESGWEHVKLIPGYVSMKQEIIGTTDKISFPLHSTSYNNLVNVCCLFVGSVTGYVHSVWPQERLLSHYRFTAPLKQVMGEGEILYTLTASGLELYTCRCKAAAVLALEDFNTQTKAFPSVTQDICLCGVHPFIGAKEMAINDTHVFLLAKIDASHGNEDTIWSLYALEKTSPSEIYKEMVSFGAKYQRSNLDTYRSMVEEGHMLLKGSIIGQSSADPSIQYLVQESSALLGEIFALPGSVDWHLCKPYYVMSGLSVTEVVRQALQYKLHLKKSTPYGYGQGFLNYLSHVLFQDNEPFQIKEEDGDMILEVCFEALPNKLSEIILFSRLQTYTPESVLKIMEAWIQHKHDVGEKKTDIDNLALAQVQLKVCDPEAALDALSSVTQSELQKLFTKNHNLLHVDFYQLSPLAQLLRQHYPRILIQCLISLHDTGTIPLDLAIRLLHGDCNQETMHSNIHLKEYLEMLISEDHRKYTFDDAVTLLVDIYIQRLKKWKPVTRQPQTSCAGIIPKCSGHFGCRYSWLDHMAPFQGPFSLKQPCLYTVCSVPPGQRKSSSTTPPSTASSNSGEICSCVLCQEDLIKLQSITCSKYMSQTLAENILSKIEDLSPENGQVALNLCCLVLTNEMQANKQVIENYPHIITDYAVSILNDNCVKWKEFIDLLLAALRNQIENQDERHDIYMSEFHGILKWLSLNTQPSDFLNILPDNGSFTFFLPYIVTCMENKQSQKLLSEIKYKGKQLHQS